MSELLKASAEGTLSEMFGKCGNGGYSEVSRMTKMPRTKIHRLYFSKFTSPGSGTAAIICPIERIGYMGKDIHINTGEDGLGDVARAVLKRIEDIQTGRLEHEWSVKIDQVSIQICYL